MAFHGVNLQQFSVNTIKMGDGINFPNKGSKVKVHYDAYLPDGKKFKSSRDLGETFDFTLGRGEVIKGWDEALNQMSLGERARVVCPPGYGYGAKGFPGSVQPGQSLIFDIELLSFN